MCSVFPSFSARTRNGAAENRDIGCHFHLYDCSLVVYGSALVKVRTEGSIFSRTITASDRTNTKEKILYTSVRTECMTSYEI